MDDNVGEGGCGRGGLEEIAEGRREEENDDGVTEIVLSSYLGGTVCMGYYICIRGWVVIVYNAQCILK